MSQELLRVVHLVYYRVLCWEREEDRKETTKVLCLCFELYLPCSSSALSLPPFEVASPTRAIERSSKEYCRTSKLGIRIQSN
eukprot:1522760-Amphidinium_carterae.2